MNSQILSQVLRDFERNTSVREQKYEQKKQEVYAKVPEILEIDKKITANMILVSKVALSPLSGVNLQSIKSENETLKLKKVDLLSKNGFSSNYLDEVYECNICKDSAYIKDKICGCVYKKYDILESRKKGFGSKNEASFDSFNLAFYSKKVNEHFGISPYENARNNLDDLKKYAMNFSQNSENLLFYGASGTSKTFLANAIAREVSKQGFSVISKSSIEIFENYESMKFSSYNQETKALIDEYKSCDLLIIDGLGNELVTTFTISAFYSLINYRIENSKPTIITTNLKVSKLSEKYSESIFSRLNGDFEQYLFFGADIREKLRQYRSI